MSRTVYSFQQSHSKETFATPETTLKAPSYRVAEFPLCETFVSVFKKSSKNVSSKIISKTKDLSIFGGKIRKP